MTRKITRALAQIKAGLQDKLYLGNLDAKRDWGYAKEYVEAMWLMLQQEQADDYVVATNETHSIREFLDVAFGHAGLDWNKYVEIRRALLPSRRSGFIDWRLQQSQTEAWLGAKNPICRPGKTNGGRGHQIVKRPHGRPR